MDCPGKGFGDVCEQGPLRGYVAGMEWLLGDSAGQATALAGWEVIFRGFSLYWAATFTGKCEA